MAPRRILSGIQPTGLMHVGNYFGAVKNWVSLQEQDAECFYCVVDLHSMTGGFAPKELPRLSMELALDLLACGIDPDRSALFLQSQIREHSELAWVLSCVAAYGDLTRMTQFKDKGSRQELVSVGLFTYPVLMAADILIYKASHVPVGDDQKQHLELTRDIAQRANLMLGTSFPQPDGLWTKATRVMSLADPTKKMSKSLGEKHYVAVFEEPAGAKKKIKSAVTDTGGAPTTEMSPGVKNLFLLLEQTAPKAVLEPLLADHAAGKLKYGDLKEAVATHLLAELEPLRERRKRLTEKDALAALAKGREKAHAIAAKTMDEVRDRIGLLKVP